MRCRPANFRVAPKTGARFYAETDFRSTILFEASKE